MSQFDKVEVMDLLINVLKEHEKCLDSLITRAEDVIEEKPIPSINLQNPPALKITLRNWGEFKDYALKAELVCFDLRESLFQCKAIDKNKLYSYEEECPILDIKQDENEKQVLTELSTSQKKKDSIPIKGILGIGLKFMINKIKLSNNSENKKPYKLDYSYTKKWLSREIGISPNFVVQGLVD